MDTTQPTDNLEASEQPEQDSVVHRIVDRIAAFSGTVSFLLINLVIYAIWMLINTIGPKQYRFDAYPFQLLTLALSLLAIALTTFVLISQNRANERDKARDKADKARQEALMQEDISLNQQEEANEQNILVLINEVKTAQQEHHEILDRLVALMEAKQPVRKYRIVGVEKQ